MKFLILVFVLIYIVFFYRESNNRRKLSFNSVSFASYLMKEKYHVSRKIGYCKYLSLVKVLKHFIRSNMYANKQYFFVTFKGLKEESEECVLILNIFILCLF